MKGGGLNKSILPHIYGAPYPIPRGVYGAPQQHTPASLLYAKWGVCLPCFVFGKF